MMRSPRAVTGQLMGDPTPDRLEQAARALAQFMEAPATTPEPPKPEPAPITPLTLPNFQVRATFAYPLASGDWAPGRRRGELSKDVLVSFRATWREEAQLREFADRIGLSRTDFIRTGCHLLMQVIESGAPTVLHSVSPSAPGYSTSTEGNDP